MFSVKHFSWEISNSCIIGKLTEYYLTTDFYQETLRTYLRDTAKLPIDVVEKVLPYSYDLFEYTRTIIKDNEMIGMRKNQAKEEKIETNQSEARKKETKQAEPKKEQKHAEIPNNEQKETRKKETKQKETKNKAEPNINKDVLNKQNKVGSNNCVISGKLTKSGHPYLCNDPHLLNSNPSSWYLINLKIENDYHLIGATVPGIPGVFIGSNGYLSFGITNGMIDTTNIIRVQRKGEDYILDGKTRSFIKRREKFYLDSSKSKMVEIEFYETEFGPVISQYSDSLYIALGRTHIEDLFDEENYFYILRSTFTNKEDYNTDALISYSLAKDFNSFREASSKLSVSLNLVYADVNIINLERKYRLSIDWSYSKEDRS
jgi:acyl-homoserine lactone acylase PvdQ